VSKRAWLIATDTKRQPASRVDVSGRTARRASTSSGEVARVDDAGWTADASRSGHGLRRRAETGLVRRIWAKRLKPSGVAKVDEQLNVTV